MRFALHKTSVNERQPGCQCTLQAEGLACNFKKNRTQAPLHNKSNHPGRSEEPLARNSHLKNHVKIPLARRTCTKIWLPAQAVQNEHAGLSFSTSRPLPAVVGELREKDKGMSRNAHGQVSGSAFRRVAFKIV